MLLHKELYYKIQIQVITNFLTQIGSTDCILFKSGITLAKWRDLNCDKAFRFICEGKKEGKWVTKQIRILLQQGSVRRVATQATFTLPIFVVPKDGGNGLRMIVYMRELNKLLKKHRFTLPTLQRDRAEFNNLLGCWTYDLTSSYQHIEIAKDDQQYFGIEWEGQTYLMTVCPYGCSTVPELFQTVAGTPKGIGDNWFLSRHHNSRRMETCSCRY